MQQAAARRIVATLLLAALVVLGCVRPAAGVRRTTSSTPAAPRAARDSAPSTTDPSGTGVASEPSSCTVRLAAHAAEAFGGTSSSPPADVDRTASRLQDDACDWARRTFGADCGDPDQVEWSRSKDIAPWGIGYAHVELRVVLARLEGSGESQRSARGACCAAVDDACAGAPRGASCSATRLWCSRRGGVWSCAAASRRERAALQEPFELSCGRRR